MSPNSSIDGNIGRYGLSKDQYAPDLFSVLQVNKRRFEDLQQDGKIDSSKMNTFDILHSEAVMDDFYYH